MEKDQQQEKVIYENNFYYRVNDDGTKDGPFCQVCYDVDKRLIRLQQRQHPMFWSCAVCNNSFTEAPHNFSG
jgi:hypothetical protein